MFKNTLNRYKCDSVRKICSGLEILAFPCNQFGEEEPGSNDQITEFVCTRFKSEFPIFDKVSPQSLQFLDIPILRSKVLSDFYRVCQCLPLPFASIMVLL